MIHYIKSSKKIGGFLLAVPVIFIWGITFVCTKALLTDFSALEILFIRFMTAYAGLWIISPHALHLRMRRDEWLFVLAGLSGVTVYQFLENMAINFTSASNVSIIVSICPMFTAVISQIFLHEKAVTGRFLFGFAVAITGIALVSFNDVVELHLSPKGDFMALGSAVSWGFYSLLVSKINALKYNPLSAVRRIFFYALIFMIPLVICGAVFSVKGINPSFSVNLNPAENAVRFSKFSNWGNLLFLGLFASAGCFAAWNKACNVLGTVYATIGIYMIPVVTVIFAFFVLGEKMTLISAVGTVCTLSGVIISGMKFRRCRNK